MIVKCKMFSNVMDKWVSGESIDKFVSEVGWENIEEIVPVLDGIIFFYEEKDEKE